MKIINISHEDFANYSHYNAMAMKSVGIDAQALCYKPHKFGYSTQAKVCSRSEIIRQIDDADIVQVMHSCGTMWDLVKHLNNKRIIVWHTGTRYRKDCHKHNSRWNPIVDFSVCALGEFMSMGAHKPVYFGITIPVEEISPSYKTNNKLIVGHYPSNSMVKGSGAINRLMVDVRRKHDISYSFSNKRVSHPRNMLRIGSCDIYVEMMSFTNSVKPYGSFGTTAIEAASLGKIVFTNNLWREVYEKEYGESMLRICNSDQEFLDEFDNVLSMTKSSIMIEKYETREWAIKNHGLRASGLRMIKLLGI